ncbi:MAG: division/cell wall cluster transcriptional repressor MraZ [Armatimonadaceae bacterium]
MGFLGEHFHTVDDKGRVIIPLKFRNDLGNTFIITRGVGGCLFIYREKDFHELEERLLSQPMLDFHTLKMKRWLFASALEASADSQGRVAIPSSLRDFAGIKEEVVIAGTGEKIEIWSRDGWDALNASLTDEEIMRSAVETGLGKSL